MKDILSPVINIAKNKIKLNNKLIDLFFFNKKKNDSIKLILNKKLPAISSSPKKPLNLFEYMLEEENFIPKILEPKILWKKISTDKNKSKITKVI